MNRETFIVANHLAETKKAAIIAQIVKSADEAAKAPAEAAPAAAADGPGFFDNALQKGKEYGPAIGYGAAGGAIAGIPIALLINALTGKDKSLRGNLRASLMGALIGGGAGALGGGGLKALFSNNESAQGVIRDGLKSVPGGGFIEGLLANGMGEVSPKLPAWDIAGNIAQQAGVGRTVYR